MKKIKHQYGKVVAPVVGTENPAVSENEQEKADSTALESEKKHNISLKSTAQPAADTTVIQSPEQKNSVSTITAAPNPFMQTKEIFNQARLTKIGYRMRTEYVEILDVIKKLKKGGYTLEAVLDDALTYYFENSEDGKDAVKKAELFYS